MIADLEQGSSCSYPPFFRVIVQIIFISCRDPEEAMKCIVAMVGALLLVVLISGCTSQVPTLSNVTTPVSGPLMTRMVTTSTDVPAPAGQAIGSPGNETRVNITHNDVFFLEPVKDYHVGDTITLHGTTILSAGNPLLIEVISSSFGPAPKNSSQSFTGVSGIATVTKGLTGGPNTWSFSFPTDGFIEDTYIVTVSGIAIDVRDSTTFVLKSRQ